MNNASTKITGQTSDGYHTFDELYEHRFELWMALCREINANPKYQYGREIWRCRVNSDGTSYPGWFLLGMGNEPGKQLTYHLPDRLWDRCEFATTIDHCSFDGHASADVLKRLAAL